MTVREAILKLVEDGLLSRRVGRGTYLVRRKPLDKSRRQTLRNVGLWSLMATQQEFHKSIVLPEIFVGIERVIAESGKNLYFAFGHRSAGGVELPNMMAENRVGGVILLGATNVITEEQLRAVAALPYVAAANYPKGHKANCVMPDNEQGIQETLSYLWDLGHRRIAFICPGVGHMGYWERFQTYCRFLSARDAFREDRVFTGDGSLEDSIDRLIKRTDAPTAFVCAHDTLAEEVIGCVRGMGKGVPEDISVTGFDDTKSERTDLALTTVRFNKEKLGALAARMLLKAMETGETAIESLVIPVELVIRGSCARVTPGIR